MKNNQIDLKNRAIQILYTGANYAAIPYIFSLRRYNITVSYQKKFLWFRVPKVGTRTILKHLEDSNILFESKNRRTLSGPLKLLFNDYFKFAFVRNPWDRLVSCWRNKVIQANYFQLSESTRNHMRIFPNFVAHVSTMNIDHCDMHLRAQSALIDLRMIDFLGRMETFDHDCKQIFDRIELPQTTIKQMNVSSTGAQPYQKYYDCELAEKVARIYQKDIKKFGYKYE